MTRPARPHHSRTRSRPALRAVVTATALVGALLAGAPAHADRLAPGTGTSTRVPPGGGTYNHGYQGLKSLYVPTAADRRIRTKLTQRVTGTRFGSAFSGAVLDAESDAVVWSKNGDTGLMPASTAKLATAANALTVFGPAHRFTTTVVQGDATNRVVVVGSGDPLLSSANLDALAAQTATYLLGRGIGYTRVYIDDDIFPTTFTLAPGWLSSYVPDDATPLHGLVRDQRNLADTGADVGKYFQAQLVANGMRASYWGRTNASASAPVLASSTGTTLSASVKTMLLNSNNDVAENLHRLVGVKRGYGNTWTAARSAQSSTLKGQGLSVKALYDGSGLSRWDRISGVQLARIVDEGTDKSRPELWPMRSPQAMPTAGLTGTLQAKYGRFTTTASKCAVGEVWAKTGTLRDAAALAGYTVGTDGRLKVFAFLVNGRDTTLTLKQNLDMLAATVNGCY